MPEKRTIPRVCQSCGGGFTSIPSLVKIGKGKYCSTRCQANGRKASIPILPAIVNDDGKTARLPLVSRSGNIRSYALIDADDAVWASRWRWSLTAGYASRSDGDGKSKRTILLHRELLGLTPGDGLYGDHINRDKLDCRRENLRAVTPPHSAQNVSGRSGSTSIHRGVTWDIARGKWIASVQIDGRRQYIGRFDSEQQAAAAAREARRQLMPFATD